MKTTYIVTPNFPPEICGIGDYSKFLFENIQEQNIDVHIITFSEGSKENDKIHLIKRKDKRKISSWLNILKKTNEVNVIIFQYEPYSFSKIGIPLYLIYISIILKIRGYKLAVMFHEVATRLYVANPKKIVISLLQLTVAYVLTSVSSLRATSTSFNAKQLKPYKFNFLPIPSNFSKNKIDVKPLDTKVKIGCFANRVDSFFASVIDQILQRKLGTIYLIGKQSNTNKEIWLKHNFYNRDNIIITGTLSPQGIEECFNNLTLFMHMEKVDLHGRGGASLKNGSLAAAFNWGLPVITAKGDMTDERQLIDKKNILFVDNSNFEDDWVNTVEYLNNHSDLEKKIKENASNFYKKNLSWPIITNKYLSLLNQK